jgi:hypothetical protein
MSDLQKLSLDNIAGGAARELFERELAAVMKNISDVNTSPKAKRKIKLSVEFTPTDARDMTAITVNCTSTLASVKPAASMAFVVNKGGETFAYAHDPRQTEFQIDTPETAGKNVVAMKGTKQ